MAKKCLVVAHSTHHYKLQFKDLTKIIFREKRNVPNIPSFHRQVKHIDLCSEEET